MPSSDANLRQTAAGFTILPGAKMRSLQLFYEGLENVRQAAAGSSFLRREEMSFLQLLGEGFGGILSQAAAGIEKHGN